MTAIAQRAARTDSDHATLAALNEDYINSVQNSDVKRFDVCTDTQLADFNRAPLPGGETHGLRVLPDGGVLVTSGAVVSRLDSTGALVQTYRVSTGEPQYWAGVDLVGDGTFWAVNYLSSNVYKFDLTTGAVLASFTTGTPAQTVVDVGVSPGAPR